MKTEVWVYTVEHDNDQMWQCVFDCEVSDARVLKAWYEENGEQYEENGKQNDDIIVQGKKCTLFQESRDPVAVIPEVASGILFSLEQNLRDKEWFNKQLVKLSLDQPIISEYLRTVKKNHGETASLIGVVVYKLIESQIEADQC